jgi:ACT domain-containing protein
MNNEIVYWTTKDGQKIDIMTMDINHLRNVLKMIVKNSNKHKVQVLTIKQEIKLNGDIANMFNNDMEDYVHECDATEWDTY